MMHPITKNSRRARALLKNSWQADRRTSAPTRARFAADKVSAPGSVHVLVAPPGNGNIGDQAMVEAFLENTPGDVVVVERHPGDVVLPAECDRVSSVSLPHLIYGTATGRRADLRRYHALLDGAATVSVVGADMMDGKYSATGSVRRLLLAELAALRGVPTRILGFSWNDAPRRSARAALAGATRAGALALLRDPDSADRARRDGITGVVETTDVVFAARSVDETVADEIRSLTGSAPYVVVNASALVARRTDQVAEYLHIVERLREEGFHTVLLPHVLRGSSNDLSALRSIAAAVGGDRVHLVDRQLSPAQVRGVAGSAAFVVTGRMHLAIMAMWGGVPAVTFSTQGKVAGLMRRFGVPQLSVEPRVGMGEAVTALFPSLGPQGAVASTIQEHLPAARAAAAQNFPGVGADGSRVPSPVTGGRARDGE